MTISRRKFLLQACAGAAVVATGCDKIDSGLHAAGKELVRGLRRPALDRGAFTSPALESIDLISHFINRLSFGARPGDYGRISAMGSEPEDSVRAYLNEQLDYEKIEDDASKYAVRGFETLEQPRGEMFEFKEKIVLDEMTRATILRATLSKRQLFEVMVEFWTDHFNIDPSKGEAKWLKAADDRDVIRTHAMGKFPNLLRASSLSPAMLWYLDGRVNRKADGQDRPNENYARELMELHTLGVHGGYTQRDVMEVARCLTGWTVREGAQFKRGTVEFKSNLHDDGAKEVLGHTIPSGLGEKDLDRVLDIVALHPSTARHISTKLCRHFISDDPSEETITSVSAMFSSSRGDVRSTLRALFETEEFRNARGVKFKRPFRYIISALRAANAETNASGPLIDYLLRMGHAPFQYPTPDGYPEEPSPWMGTLLWRWNFAVALSQNKIHGTRIDVKSLKQNFGGDEALMAHLLARRPAQGEIESYHASGDGLALMLASPAFQRC